MSLPTNPLPEPITIDAEQSQKIEVYRIPDPGDGGPAVAIRVVWEVPNSDGEMVREYRQVGRALVTSKWDDSGDLRTYKAWCHAIINSTAS